MFIIITLCLGVYFWSTSDWLAGLWYCLHWTLPWNSSREYWRLFSELRFAICSKSTLWVSYNNCSYCVLLLVYAMLHVCSSGRLLLIHGLCDENVFFKHSSKLSDKLIDLGKPHVTQFYCRERHGLRSFSALTHCDATVLQFLNQNL